MTRDELHKRLIEVAAQSPAKKRKVGAIIAVEWKDNDFCIISEGYNFNPSGGPCETEENITHENVVHAEVNAINEYIKTDLKLFADSHGYGPEITQSQLKLYCTHPPCDGCKAAILAANIEYEVMGDFLKFDSNKPRMALVPASLGYEVGRVVTYGAKKYKVNNWRKVKSQEPYINALERHLAAYKNGEVNDPESGLSHMSHIACNAAFLLELQDLPIIEGDK
jgi:deoxycytidylate deaminase